MKVLRNCILISIFLLFAIVLTPKSHAFQEASFDIKGLNSNNNAVVDTEVYVKIADLNNDDNFKAKRFCLSFKPF